MERPLSGPEVTNPWQFGLILVGGPSKNILKSDSLSLPTFPTQDYTPLFEVAELVLYVPPP
jgi:hypothetical protein